MKTKMGKIKLLFFIFFLFFLAFSVFALPNFGSKNLGGFAQDLEVQYPTVPGAPLPAQPTLPQYIKYLYNFSIILAGLIALFSLAYGGFRYLISAGSPAAMADARDQISAGLIGLVILLGSYLFLVAVNPQLAILKLEAPQALRCSADVDCSAGQVCRDGKCTFIPQEIELVAKQYELLEIPIGTLIERVLDLNRLNAIRAAAGEARRRSEIINIKASELVELLNQCSCGNTSPNAISCTPGVACPATACTGDPCRNRAQIDAKKVELKTAAEDLKNWIRTGPLLQLIAEFNREATRLQIAKLLLTETLLPINYDNFLELKEGVETVGGQTVIIPFEFLGQTVRPVPGNDPSTFYIDKEINRDIIETIGVIGLPFPPIGPVPPGPLPPIPGPFACPLGVGSCSVDNLIDPFGEHAWEASTVCQAESGANPWALNSGCQSGISCEWSVGLFQLNIIYECPGIIPSSPLPAECLASPGCTITDRAALEACAGNWGWGNPEANIREAYIMFLNRGWLPWSAASACGLI